MKIKNNSLGLILATLAVFIWASSFIGIKIALQSIAPMSIIALRMLIASLLFAFFARHLRANKLRKSDVKFILLLGLFEPILYFVFEIKALELTSASQAGVITSTMPLVASFGAWLILKEKLSKNMILGLCIAMVGAILLSINAKTHSYAPNPLLGNFLEFLAMICSAGYAIVLKLLSDRYSPLYLTAMQSFMGVIFFLPFGIYECTSQNFMPSTQSLLAVLYLGVFVTALAYWMFNYSLTISSVARVSTIVNLMPIFTIFLAFLILHETLSLLEISCSFLIFFGIFVSQWLRFK